MYSATTHTIIRLFAWLAHRPGLLLLLRPPALQAAPGGGPERAADGTRLEVWP